MIQPSIPRETDLNTATSEELARLPGIGADKAWDLMQHRPYRDWEDVRRIPGFSQDAVEVLQRAGATIRFEPAPSKL